MSCYHPLKAFEIGIKDNGKKDLKITEYDVDHLEFRHGKWQKVYEPIRLNVFKNIRSQYLEVPCGQCIGCRLDHAKLWADRMMLEVPYHKHCWFITLTYNDNSIPVNNIDENGEVRTTVGLSNMVDEYSVTTLRKKDFQDFIKRLRRYVEYHKIPDSPCRYFACGEYGDNTRRPHMHAIIFGLEIPDLVPFSKNENGDVLYTSEMLSKIWSVGFVTIGECTWNTCDYVARYVIKKQKGVNKELSDCYSFESEFALMSRKPGIGRMYYEDNKDSIFEYDHIYLDGDNTRQLAIPKYFERIKEIEDNDFVDKRKKKKIKVSKMSKSESLQRTDLTYKQLLKVRENTLNAKIQSIKSRKDY